MLDLEYAGIERIIKGVFIMSVNKARKMCFPNTCILPLPPVIPTQQRIKVNAVICQDQVQIAGDLLLAAPAGVVLDPATGLLDPAVTLVAGATIIRTITVLPNKVVIQGVVQASLLVDGVVVIALLEIPFQSIVDCCGALPGDTVQIHNSVIEGVTVSPVQIPVAGVLILNLVLKVILSFCVVVARESIVALNGTVELFCQGQAICPPTALYRPGWGM